MAEAQALQAWQKFPAMLNGGNTARYSRINAFAA